MKIQSIMEECNFSTVGSDLANAYDDGCRSTASECYAIVNKKCDPEFNICDGRLYRVGYQAALRDIKKCLEERFGEEIKK